MNNTVGPDPTVEPSDLNNKTQVTGTAFSADGSTLAMRWQNGATKVLGALPGHVESHGNSINNKGQIVGQSCRAWPESSVFLWQDGVMRDLNDLVSDGSLALVESGKINDRGQIVGLAFTNGGELHGFLATPHDDASGTSETAAVLSKPQRLIIALPEVVQKMLDRQMRHKTRHFWTSSEFGEFAITRFQTGVFSVIGIYRQQCISHCAKPSTLTSASTYQAVGTQHSVSLRRA